MKKFNIGLLVGLLIGLLVGTTSLAVADSPVKLIVNGKTIACDTPPQVINGRVMVPARYVAEPLGASVTWDSTNNAVIVNGTGYVGATQSTVKNSPIDSLVTSDKQEFLALSQEADRLIAKSEKLVSVDSAIKQEYDTNIQDLKDMCNKLVAWGDVTAIYDNAKHNYVVVMEDLAMASCYRSILTDKDYAADKYKFELEQTLDKLVTDKLALQAEKTRLQKLNCL